MTRLWFPMLAFASGVFAGSVLSAQWPMAPRPVHSADSQILAVIRAHGDIILEAIQAENVKRRQQVLTQAQALLRDHEGELIEAGPDTPILGNPAGRHVLVYFFDATCHFCRDFDPNLKAMIAQDPELKLVLRQLAFLGPRGADGRVRSDAPSAIAALYGDAVWHLSHAGFAHFMDLMMTRPIGDPSALAALAAAEKLDAQALAKFPGGEARIERNAALFRLAGGQGTPLLLVKGAAGLQAISGAVAPATIEAIFSTPH